MNGTHSFFFSEATLRLMQQLGVTKNKEVAEILGNSEKGWAARRRRNAFPEKDLRALAQQRPELGIDVNYVLTGVRAVAATAYIGSPQTGMTLPEVAHAMNRVAPAMESGFVIQTSYGDLAIAPGPLAERIRDLVAQHAQRELTRLAAQEGANHG